MNRNNIRLGLMWISGLCSGAIVGMIINEKINQKYLQPSVDRYKDLAESIKDELFKSYDEIEKLRNKINNEDEA